MGIERQKSIVNPPTPTNTSLSILTTLFAIKKSVAKTSLRRADFLPSSLNSKAEERKYVSSVLKANGFTKTFLRNCQKPVTTSNTPVTTNTSDRLNVSLVHVSKSIEKLFSFAKKKI